jgi:predicted SAM-dependent methyltransferase
MRLSNSIKPLISKSRSKASVKNILKSQSGPIKLNVGCGTDYKEGWINIDNNSDDNIEKLDLNWDLRDPLPFADNSVDFIFNEHFFEHLTVEEGQSAMKDMLRILKPGGVMRIAMPDLESVVDHYLNVPLSEDQVIKDHHLSFVKTRAEWMNMSFRWWGHKWLYDWEELSRRLSEAGFKKHKRCMIYKSSHKALRNLEIRQGSILIAEATK